MNSRREKNTEAHRKQRTSGFPPWLFQHKDLLEALDEAKSIEASVLTNRINHLHFINGQLYVLLRNPKYLTNILLKANPGPCINELVSCRWSEENPSEFNFSDYQLLHLVIDDGQSLILIPGSSQDLNERGFVFQLTGRGFSVGKRQTKRYAYCNEVTAELTQGGISAGGQLLDFSPIGYRIRITSESPLAFKWFNSDEPITIQLRYGKRVFLSTNCHCIRRLGEIRNMELVLVPAEEMISRYKKRRIRNPRQRLLPAPVLRFFHPLLNKYVELVISDISTSGFSVYEVPQESLLLQGMIIPDLVLEFSGALRLKCLAQVLYRLEEEEKVRCGIAILDMDVNSYSRLSHILSNAFDPHAFVSQKIDPEALWEFLFESGFIYPLKYKLIQSHRDEFKKTYRKLYQESPEIAKHITYQRHGKIEGHISTVHIYERSWMIHHHAARKSYRSRAGIKVLKDLMLYLNDMHRLPSTDMDYAICYYRPQNRFPDRLFGSFARELNNPVGCSLDLFTYCLSTTQYRAIHCPTGWSLQESSSRDIWELSQFYDHRSGGLFLDMMGLRNSESGAEKLESVYQRHGLMRKWKIYSLSYETKLHAVLIVEQSDLGLNLSELLNSIKIIVTETNSGNLSWDILALAIGELKAIYDTDEIPVLIYPHNYSDSQGIPYEKHYYLWILNVQYGNTYLEFMADKFGVNR